MEWEPSKESSQPFPIMLIFKAGIDFVLGSSLPLSIINYTTEPVFSNVYGAQESIPRDEFRKPM
jgi:hypothetical protein